LLATPLRTSSMTAPQVLGSLPASPRESSGELVKVVPSCERPPRVTATMRLEAAVRGPYSREPEQPCAQFALCLISSKWAIDILLALRGRPLRFGALSRQLERIARKVLTQTLRTMERDGLLWRSSTGRAGKPVEYGVTALGTSLLEILAPLERWSECNESHVRAARAEYDGANGARRDAGHAIASHDL
jgi:DNA-binding HxlR family transcriptional regulator